MVFLSRVTPPWPNQSLIRKYTREVSSCLAGTGVVLMGKWAESSLPEKREDGEAVSHHTVYSECFPYVLLLGFLLNTLEPKTYQAKSCRFSFFFFFSFLLFVFVRASS